MKWLSYIFCIDRIYMDIKTLRYFVVVAEELNITKASKILMMSQPPLSNQIKHLEEELNTTLCIRGKRHLGLTEEGKYLYQKAKDIIYLNDKTTNEILLMNKGLSGTISIGLVEGMAPDIAAEWISDFLIKNPNVRFRILDGNSDDLIEKMRAGLISLAVITSPYDQILLNSFKVGEEKIVALINKDHPLAKLENNIIKIEDLKDEKIIVPSRKVHVDTIRKWFKKIHIDPNIVCEMDNYLDAAAMANRGVGISIFPKTGYITNNNLCLKEIEGNDKKIDYLFVWRKGHQLSTLEENFIDSIKNKYPTK